MRRLVQMNYAAKYLTDRAASEKMALLCSIKLE